MGDDTEKHYADTVANNVFVRELLKRLEKNNLEQNKLTRQLLEAYRDAHNSTTTLNSAVKELVVVMKGFTIEVVNLRLAIVDGMPNGHPVSAENIDGQQKG